MAVKKRKRPGLLSHTRPRLPTAKQLTPSAPAVSLSSKATRNLINSHHQLLKVRERAACAGDEALVSQIDAKIDANGDWRVINRPARRGSPVNGAMIRVLSCLNGFVRC